MARLFDLITAPDTRCWILGPDGWSRVPADGPGMDIQEELLRGGSRVANDAAGGRSGRPARCCGGRPAGTACGSPWCTAPGTTTGRCRREGRRARCRRSPRPGRCRRRPGVVAPPQVRLPTTSYLTGEPDTEKTVDLWSMRAIEVTAFEANDEVSEVRWVGVAEAGGLLTYVHDRGVVTSFASAPQVTGMAVLVRHAHAGSRKRWDGPDDRRPLDLQGQQQAAALGPLLSLFKPARVYAAPLARCIDTVAPIGLPVRSETVFAAAKA